MRAIGDGRQDEHNRSPQISPTLKLGCCWAQIYTSPTAPTTLYAHAHTLYLPDDTCIQQAAEPATVEAPH
jgi:hypothetical protein